MRSALVLLAFVPGLLAQVKFTKPDVNQKLNISAPSIVVAWTVEPGSQEADTLPLVDLWWNGKDFGYEIAKNLSVAAGVTEYAWDPRSERDALRKSNYPLAEGNKDFYFQVRFHELNSSRGSGIRSESYAVEGYKNSTGTSAGYRVGVQWGAAVAVLGTGFSLL